MSAFIDSMTSDEEARLLEAHVSDCAPCRRQLRAYVSLRNLVAGVAAPEVPEDLALETRIRLSHERSRNFYGNLNIRLKNILKPLAVPALAGVSTTALCFVFLLGSLSPPPIDLSASAETPLWLLMQPPRATDPLMTQLAELGLDQVTLDLKVDQRGKAFATVILNGPQDPELDQWLRDVLLLGDFHPATILGRPVPAPLILSFIGVKSSPVV